MSLIPTAEDRAYELGHDEAMALVNAALDRVAAAEARERVLREALANLLPLIPSYGYGVPEREAQRRAIKSARAALSAHKEGGE